MFMFQAWYVAALSSELGATGFFHRKLLGVSVLLYRMQSGEAVALQDRCPHRFAPLHLGNRLGDNVVCPYHGLQFNSQGQCVHSPHGKGHIPTAAVVRAFPAAERFGFIWVWMGNREDADAGLIPDYGLLADAPPNSKGYGYLQMPTNYEIVVDNIMDLSHVDFVHGPLLNTAGKLSSMTPKVTGTENAVSIRWEWHQDPPLGFFAPFLAESKSGAEHWVQINWIAPASMLLTVGAVQGSHRYDEGLISWDYHIMTPATESATHYFFATHRNWLVDDAELNAAKLEGTLAAFATEDRPLIGAVQEEMGTTDLWSLNPVLMQCDVAAVRVRRTLEKLIVRESKPANSHE